MTIRSILYTAASYAIEPVRIAVDISSRITTSVGGLRVMGGTISAIVEAVDYFDISHRDFSVLTGTLKSFQAGMSGINVIKRASEFFNDKAKKVLNPESWSDFLEGVSYCASRICFIAYDILAGLQFLENVALIAAGTANKVAFRVFSTTSQSIQPALNWGGWAFDFVYHANCMFYKPTIDTGLSLTSTSLKLVSIALTGATSGPLKVIKIVSQIGSGGVFILHEAIRYAKERTKTPA